MHYMHSEVILQDQPGAWPDKLVLEGFSYTHLGGLAEESETKAVSRETSWFKAWLASQEDYSPQPYKQLANILEKMGHKEKAKEILYTGKERERHEASVADWILLTGSKWTIGYSYYYGRIIYWIAGTTAVGMIILLAN
jgi:hypothetical protein